MEWRWLCWPFSEYIFLFEPDGRQLQVQVGKCSTKGIAINEAARVTIDQFRSAMETKDILLVYITSVGSRKRFLKDSISYLILCSVTRCEMDI